MPYTGMVPASQFGVPMNPGLIVARAGASGVPGGLILTSNIGDAVIAIFMWIASNASIRVISCNTTTGGTTVQYLSGSGEVKFVNFDQDFSGIALTTPGPIPQV